MRPASFGIGLGRKAAITRPETKKIKIRAYSLNDLFRLTRAELFAFHAEILAELAWQPEAAANRHVALGNLRLIRLVLAQPRYASR